MLSGYITTLKNKQKLNVSSEGPSSRVSSFYIGTTYTGTDSLRTFNLPYLCNAPAMFVLFWSNLCPLLDDCFNLRWLVDFRYHCFCCKLQIFALQFEIIVTALKSTNHSRVIFLCIYYIKQLLNGVVIWAWYEELSTRQKFMLSNWDVITCFKTFQHVLERSSYLVKTESIIVLLFI